MIKICCIFLLAIILLNPAPAAAAENMVNLTVICQSDGVATGEIRFNDRLVWRIRILVDGAKAASTGIGLGNTTVIVPDIINGQFLLKIKGE